MDAGPSAGRQERRSTSSRLQSYSKNLKRSELSRAGRRLKYKIADLIPRVDVASSNLVTRSRLRFVTEKESCAITRLPDAHVVDTEAINAAAIGSRASLVFKSSG
jgi:hypothetical protein